MKKVKEPAPHVKAAQIEKEAVRALSVDEVEEALTKSTFRGEDREVVKQMDDENKELRENFAILKTEFMDLKNENRRLKESIDQTNGQLRVRERELDEAKKTISKMKYAHEEEVRALEDELAEAKILAKKRGEAVDELDECCVTFSKIRFMANTAVDMAASLRKMAHMIEEEAEEHC